MNLTYGIHDKPKFTQTIVFAFQQLLAIMAATIAVPAIIGACLIMVGVLPAAGLASYAGHGATGMLSEGVAVTAAVGAGLFGAIFAFVVAVAIAICSVGAQALSYRAYGYWVGQFQPAKWGGIEEPMPFEPGYRSRSHAAPSQEPAATSFQDVAAAAGAIRRRSWW